jgi:putative FmdB family regulatory protein
MPLYEYECSKCGGVFEVRQKFSDEPVTVHENCGGAVVKLMSAPAFSFKGSGWYVTDYGKGGSHGGAISAEKSESKPAGAATESKASESKSESTSSESKSTEAKPATVTKTESKPAATTSTKSD